MPEQPISSQEAYPRWLVPALFVLTAIWPLFMHLDTLPIRVWDEARQAVSALEMAENGNYLVTHLNGQPEMWSTKPPLLIWLQAAFCKAIGPGELAVRLPSAIAALFTGWFLLRVCIRRLNAPWLGLGACLILYTNEGYINMHVARSGDYDALLILWLTTSTWAIFRWSLEKRPADLLWFFVLLACGALTKSVQALLFLPGIGIYLLMRKQLRELFAQRMLYVGMAVFLFLVGGFYLARESVNPGYLQAVWENELGGRYATALDGHDHPWDFYIRMLIDHHFTSWWLLVPAGLVLGLVLRDDRLRHWSLLLTCVGAGYLYIISSANTKLIWYEAPLIALVAGLAAVPIHLAVVWLSKEAWSSSFLRARVLPYVFLFTVFVQPYSTTVGQLYFPKELPWDEDFYAISYYLQKAQRGSIPLEADVISYDAYNIHLVFYLRLLKEQGKELRSISKHDLQPGMRVLASEWFVRDTIEKSYAYELVYESGTARIYRILGPRESAM